MLVIVFCVYLAFSVISISELGAQTQSSCNNLKKPDFIGVSNHVLEGFVYSRTRTVFAVKCVRDCVSDPRCVSINYFDSVNYCELNNATRSQFPEKFCEFKGSVYFDEEENGNFGTSFLSPELASCKELLRAAGGNISSGVYTIFPRNLSGGLEVYCDTEGNNGGWIVFQRRQNGSVDFYRNWADYQRGFGDLKGEFWLGNDYLRALTEASPPGTWELRIDMEDWGGKAVWVDYSDFKITGEKYTLNAKFNLVSEANVGDSLRRHVGEPFSTKDTDNDNYKGSCAKKDVGAWWYDDCHDSNLNGMYYKHHNVENNKGLQWETWKGDYYSLKKCSMKIREINCTSLNP